MENNSGSVNVFDYASFSTYYDEMKKTTLGTDGSSIQTLLSDTNDKVYGTLSKYSDSYWASEKLDEWNKLMPSIQAHVAQLATMLEKAKYVSEQYNAFETANASMNIESNQ